MHAVVRETTYSPESPIYETAEFRQFQEVHARQPGYHGTVVVDVGSGRFLTLTFWDSAETMQAAREAVGPTVVRLLEPIMTKRSQLLGTGPVVLNDL